MTARRWRFLVPVAALALVAVVLFVRDGSTTKAEYQRTVAGVYADIQRAFRATGTAGAELAARVAGAQKALRDGADRLEDLDPPEEVEADNDRLAQAMEEYADDLEEVRVAAERGDSQAVADFNARIGENRWIMQMAAAVESMEAKGYELGPIAEE